MYLPQEDSFFFADFLKTYLKNKNKSISILDMGAGSGILAETCLSLGFKNVSAADIDSKAVKYLENKFKDFKAIHIIKSNLFSNSSLKKRKFDLILFNAPYLPKDKYDREKDTTGGKLGDEISIKFLKQAKKHLFPGGKILLLVSSLTPMNRIKKFNPEIIARKKLFFEELLILEFSSYQN